MTYAALAAQELEEALACGALSDVLYCFSREPGEPKVYVQDGIAANASKLAKVLDAPNAHYYVCGDATMAGVVAGELRKAVGLEVCANMEATGRWHEDIFGTRKAADDASGGASKETAAKLKALESDMKASSCLLYTSPSPRD